VLPVHHLKINARPRRRAVQNSLIEDNN
jgi:hypothetical protein